MEAKARSLVTLVVNLHRQVTAIDLQGFRMALGSESVSVAAFREGCVLVVPYSGPLSDLASRVRASLPDTGAQITVMGITGEWSQFGSQEQHQTLRKLKWMAARETPP